MPGRWYTIHVNANATLKELRDEIAKKIYTPQFRLYRIVDQDDESVAMNDIILPNGTAQHMSSEEDDEEQLKDLGVLNRAMFSVTIRLI